MTRATKFFAGLGLALGLLAGLPQTSQASGEQTEVQNDNGHYFVHAGNCSRSMQLRGSYTCHDEAVYAAQELQANGYIRVWVNTSPRSYL